MKVLVHYTVEVDDGYRKAINHHHGIKGRLATRAEVKDWFEEFGHSMNDDLPYEHRECCWGNSGPYEEEE